MADAVFTHAVISMMGREGMYPTAATALTLDGEAGRHSGTIQ